MTEKRFKQVVDGVKDTRTGRTLTHPLEFTLKLNEINELYDCVFDRNEELEKENEQLKSENEDMRRLINNISHQRDEFHHGARENANHVGKLEKENKELKKRNNNQYQQLTELWQIIEEENWGKLIAMKKQLKEDEEQLQKEWKCYE